MSAQPRPGNGMIGMTETITATSDQACNLRIGPLAGLEPATYGLEVGQRLSEPSR
jgi:hypothetical protein